MSDFTTVEDMGFENREWLIKRIRELVIELESDVLDHGTINPGNLCAGQVLALVAIELTGGKEAAYHCALETAHNLARPSGHTVAVVDGAVVFAPCGKEIASLHVVDLDKKQELNS